MASPRGTPCWRWPRSTSTACRRLTSRTSSSTRSSTSFGLWRKSSSCSTFPGSSSPTGSDIGSSGCTPRSASSAPGSMRWRCSSWSCKTGRRWTGTSRRPWRARCSMPSSTSTPGPARRFGAGCQSCSTATSSAPAQASNSSSRWKEARTTTTSGGSSPACGLGVRGLASPAFSPSAASSPQCGSRTPRRPLRLWRPCDRSRSATSPPRFTSLAWSTSP
mmetsp:Transcript_109830/g.215289  ORF Transcript_109830/g.215289 Transcript_109830/m.215289 type:complete len:219 (+) Transcript_109830:1-657(+)